MELTIVTDKTSNTLKRRDVHAQVTFMTEKTPSRAQIRELVAKRIGVDKECVSINKIGTDFGSSQADINVHVYATKEELSASESAYMKRRQTGEKRPEKAKKKK